MKNNILLFIYAICRLLPINMNKMIFFSYYGVNYGGSPKYLSKYIKSVNPKFEIVWAFVDCKKHQYLNKEYKVIKYNSIKYWYNLATSKVIITNYRMTSEFKKRDSQIYIQTWHSSLRLKYIEKDAENSLSEEYIHMAKNDSKQIDLLLSGSKASEEIFRKSFWYEGEILKSGVPQCDIFFQNNDFLNDKIKKMYNIDTTTKIVLYAPTFRKNNDFSVYDLNYEQLKKSLSKKFGGNWCVFVRLHPHLIKYTDLINSDKGIVNVSEYDDIQELLAISNIVITDYSALMFDYILTRRPCFLYVADYKKYINRDRKLYFDINKLPFLIIHNNDEIEKVIDSFDIESYQNDCNHFIEKEIYSYDDGNASKRILDYLKEK